jgi:5-methyltetrahydrofolate--homocysteine methyltransferase
VGVVSKLLSEERDSYIETVRASYAKLKLAHERGRAAKTRTSIAAARANKYAIDWKAYTPPRPGFFGTRAFKAYDLASIARYIDWTPFFATWEIKGTYPMVLDDSRYGHAARPLFEDAQAMLEQIVAENWVAANGVIGFWPANTVGDDDIRLYTDDDRRETLAMLHTLRQQISRGSSERANTALADFVAPEGVAPDYIGAFAVTAGIGEHAIADRFERANDDYSKIMVKALADRLAEAFAELLHERVRREFWAYAPDETLTIDELIKERYKGIRPAPGYPAQPDHTEKATLFELLDAEQAAGMKLTESFAMIPGAAVSGLYFAHPGSHYFGVGKIDRDQVEDYARRKGWPLTTAEKWLTPILNYEPSDTENSSPPVRAAS